MFHASVTGRYAHTVMFIMDAVPLHVWYFWIVTTDDRVPEAELIP
jgi:hypothetical protein